ncbi:putative bifunctional diguanylate cyclase/phosphodiesterase [Erythrobacter sp. W53]|uniref:putative bifunctional diguanylate cyclase/phosphodiesterase n=1 Tax=Erythrobacter sp. W53 TaxID=3425947 RepID=UPI003D7693E9
MKNWSSSSFTGSVSAIGGPLLVLSAVFAATLATIILVGETGTFTLAIIAFGSLAYLITSAVLFWYGARRLTHFQGLGQEDSLTGLPNRRALHADFESRDQVEEEVAIALIDLDGFLNVNEQYGHAVGDRVICECAKVLSEMCADEARVYRLGGDEFAILLEGPVAGTLLEGLSRRIIERLGHPIKVEERRLILGASIGLARAAAQDNLGSSELLRRADVAMYASKRSGRARCTWFSPEFDVTREQVRELDEDLRGALANGEFNLVYQPLVDCRTRMVVAVECLIRWERPDGKNIGPNVFIPIAEQSGLINPIGLWVLRRSCLDALEWNDIKLSVNISAAQLRNPEFPIELGQILEETGFPPERLELEITETCLVLDPVIAERSLAVIRGFGVNVALDDFGTGYASIGFLRQFRFEKLKLDRSLVVDAGEDDGSRAMMLSSITVARALKMAVTAEGVETTEQADMVRAAGCDQIQGWLYFKPMPREEIPAYLDKEIDVPVPAQDQAALSAPDVTHSDKGSKAA